MKKIYTVHDRECILQTDEAADTVLILPAGGHDAEALTQLKIFPQGQEIPYTSVILPVSDWNRDLSPWPAAAVFGNEDFGGGAAETLRLIEEELLPEIERDLPEENRMHYVIGGYSLAGLFALWAAYQSDRFEAVAAVSPSVWFPGWDRYIESREIRAKHVYLSLGTKEGKTRHPVMSQVDNRIRLQYELLKRKENHSAVLEWNPGNHFRDHDLRMAKGLAWCLRQIHPEAGKEKTCPQAGINQYCSGI